MSGKADLEGSRKGSEQAKLSTPLLLLAPASGQQTHGEDRFTSKKELMEKREQHLVRAHGEKERGR